MLNFGFVLPRKIFNDDNFNMNRKSAFNVIDRINYDRGETKRCNIGWYYKVRTTPSEQSDDSFFSMSLFTRKYSLRLLHIPMFIRWSNNSTLTRFTLEFPQNEVKTIPTLSVIWYQLMTSPYTDTSSCDNPSLLYYVGVVA